MPWIQAHLTIDKERAPLVELLLETLGALSITLEDAGDEPMLEPLPGETPLWSHTRISGLFEGTTDPDRLRSSITQALNRDSVRQLELEVVEDRDWERAWLDNFQPIQFGQRLWICPTGKTVPEPAAVVVSLDPGLAFGTGTHPTTALCLERLDQTSLEGKTLIDYGCGSGILAIAALKLGARQAIAVDHDPQAIVATRTNADRNQVNDRLETRLTDDFTPLQADIVVANILANILVELAPAIISLVKPGGLLILSGILQNQAKPVTDAYEKAICFDAPVQREGWIRMDGVKSNQAELNNPRKPRIP